MNIDKRYQIFISSTFRDLMQERQAVLKAVLELDHMPAGMELFPAADSSAWQLIQGVIDASDYYVLIISGRYGSVDETGIGYTEKEYEYALTSKKPVIPCLHKNPDNLPRELTETDEGAWEKLKTFRSKVEKRHTCVYWDSVDDLKAKVIVGVTAAAKRSPAIGWVRADQVPSGATLTDILVLRNRVTELEAEIEKSQSAAPVGIEDLQQGDDRTTIGLTFQARPSGEFYGKNYRGTIEPTWNEVFAAVAPSMISEISEDALLTKFSDRFEKWAIAKYRESPEIKGYAFSQFKFDEGDIDTCIVQLRALRLIKESTKKRSLKDTDKYWILTPYGDLKMVQLRALRKFDKLTEHSGIETSDAENEKKS